MKNGIAGSMGILLLEEYEQEAGVDHRLHFSPSYLP